MNFIQLKNKINNKKRISSQLSKVLILSNFFFLMITFYNCHSYSKVGFYAGAAQHSEDFKGIANSDFTQIQQMETSFGFYILSNQWLYKFESNTVAPTQINEFVLADGQVGSFEISFQKNLIGFGRKINRWGLYIIVGQEDLKWSGTIDMKPKKSSTQLVGFEYFYNLIEKNKFIIPVFLRVLSQSQRQITFSDYPYDTLNIASGTNIDAGLRLSLEF